MEKLRIALGDLRHGTTGRHSISIPIGIGYIASYTFAEIGKENVDIRLYDDPDVLMKELDLFKPDVIGLSNYCWNSELSGVVFNQAKKRLPNVTCIAGGPEFPLQPEKCKHYLSMRKAVDFYVYREGEVAFSSIIRKIISKADRDSIKNHTIDGVMYIRPLTKELVIGRPLPRLKNLDKIPSPYTTGLMDQWFNGHYAPLLETARGCPFSCGYCFAGQAWCSPISRFSVDRIKKELSYIAERMTEYPGIYLGLCDANFGMYERDEEIASHLRYLQDKYHWPNNIDVTTGKQHYDRIMRIAAQLHDKLRVTCSMQSLNPETLKIIKRVNIQIDQYAQIQEVIKRKGMMSTAELIIPMPEETRESYFMGIKRLFESGVECVSTYTTMLLKSTYLDSEECREKYDYMTKFRIIPRQFGEYAGERCFEVEEVCVATNAMSFEDYLECRGFAFVSAVISSEQYDIIRRHVKENNISIYDFLYELWMLIKSAKTKCSHIYDNFIKETQRELWKSKEGIYEFYSQVDNYKKLLKGELGDNLMRKYETNIFLNGCVDLITLAYSLLEAKCPKEVWPSLQAAMDWSLACRNVSLLLNDASYLKMRWNISSAYDVCRWYSDVGSKPLLEFKKDVKYSVYYDAAHIEKILQQAETLFGNDKTFVIGKTLNNWSIREFWAKCDSLA